MAGAFYDSHPSMLIAAFLSQFPADRVKVEPQPCAGPAPRQFMWLGGAETGFGASGVTLRDNGRRLSMITKGIPIWFVVASLAMPLMVVAGVFIYRRWIHGSYNWMLLPFFILWPFVLFEFISLVRWLNRRAGAGAERAVVDRVARTLELRDDGIILSAASVKELILIRGWQKKKSHSGSTTTWTAELSAVATASDERLLRWHVVSGYGRSMDRFAEEASRVLGAGLVRHRV